MSTDTITACGAVAAPPAVVYAIIANYREHHPNICPPRFFRNFVVEQGGTGAGTIVRFEAVVMGRGNVMRSEITEPEPGRVLAERDIERGMYTTFTVEPKDEGRTSEVTITTRLPHRPGLVGGIASAVERAVSKRLLPPVYAEELERLAAYATSDRAPHLGANVATPVATPAPITART